MAALKTKKNDGNVSAFLAGIENRDQRADSLVLYQMMAQITGKFGHMYGSSIVGFGSYTFRYASGKEGQWFLTGFSPRKQSLAIYIMAGLERYSELLAQLGKHKTGKSCLYIKQLADVDMAVLRGLIKASCAFITAKNTEE